MSIVRRSSWAARVNGSRHNYHSDPAVGAGGPPEKNDIAAKRNRHGEFNPIGAMKNTRKFGKMDLCPGPTSRVLSLGCACANR